MYGLVPSRVAFATTVVTTHAYLPTQPTFSGLCCNEAGDVWISLAVPGNRALWYARLMLSPLLLSLRHCCPATGLRACTHRFNVCSFGDLAAPYTLIATTEGTQAGVVDC